VVAVVVSGWRGAKKEKKKKKTKGGTAARRDMLGAPINVAGAPNNFMK